MTLQRRDLLKATGAAGALALAGCAANMIGTPNRARVLVVGGGFGGATAAKYVRLLSDSKIDVVLVEPDAAFVSCPLSNLVLGGTRLVGDLTVPYTALTRQHGVTVVKDMVASIDPAKRLAVLASGASIAYDKLVLSPGVEMMWDRVAGLQDASAQGRILQAWKAGAETVALRRQLETMPDGGVFAIEASARRARGRRLHVGAGPASPSPGARATVRRARALRRCPSGRRARRPSGSGRLARATLRGRARGAGLRGGRCRSHRLRRVEAAADSQQGQPLGGGREGGPALYHVGHPALRSGGLAKARPRLASAGTVSGSSVSKTATTRTTMNASVPHRCGE